MTKVNIIVDSEKLLELSKLFPQGMTEAALPNTSVAVEQAANYVRNVWTDYLAGETSLDGIENLEKVTSSMIRSIKQRKLRDMMYEVYSNNTELEKLTNGTPDVDYDMKKTHPYGLKSRVSSKGIPYLIIPFRWGTPNSKGTKRRWNNFIPQKIYDTNVKGLSLSETVPRNPEKLRLEKNFSGDMIERANYNWGSRLKEADDDRMKGMVRMKNATKSTYFTFRIISAKSPAGSWIYHRDGKPGIDMMGALQRTVEKNVKNMIQQGIDADDKYYFNQ